MEPTVAQLQNQFGHYPGVRFTNSNKVRLYEELSGKKWMFKPNPALAAVNDAVASVFSTTEFRAPLGDGTGSTQKKPGHTRSRSGIDLRNVTFGDVKSFGDGDAANGAQAADTKSHSKTVAEDEEVPPDGIASEDLFAGVTDVDGAFAVFNFSDIIDSHPNDDCQSLADLVQIMKGTDNEHAKEAFPKLCGQLTKTVALPGQKRATEDLFNVGLFATKQTVERAEQFLLTQAITITDRCQLALLFNRAQKNVDDTNGAEKAAVYPQLLMIKAMEQAYSWIKTLPEDQQKPFIEKMNQIFEGITTELVPQHDYTKELKQLSPDQVDERFALASQFTQLVFTTSLVDLLPGAVLSLYPLPSVLPFSISSDDVEGIGRYNSIRDGLEKGTSPDFLFYIVATTLFSLEPELLLDGSVEHFLTDRLAGASAEMKEHLLSGIADVTKPSVTRYNPKNPAERVEQYATSLIKTDPQNISARVGSLLTLLDYATTGVKTELTRTEFPISLQIQFRGAVDLLANLEKAYSVFPPHIQSQYNNVRLGVLQALMNSYRKSSQEETKTAWKTYEQACQFTEVIPKFAVDDGRNEKAVLDYLIGACKDFEAVYLPLTTLVFAPPEAAAGAVGGAAASPKLSRKGSLSGKASAFTRRISFKKDRSSPSSSANGSMSSLALTEGHFSKLFSKLPQTIVDKIFNNPDLYSKFGMSKKGEKSEQRVKFKFDGSEPINVGRNRYVAKIADAELVKEYILTNQNILLGDSQFRILFLGIIKDELRQLESEAEGKYKAFAAPIAT